jgi:hypothetical protein
MILIFAILFILIQPVAEAIQNNFKPEWNSTIRKIGIPARIIIGAIWFFTCTSPTIYYVATWRLIVGYIIVAFAIYDTVWNLTSIILGKKIPLWYYGDTKKYDQIMIKLASFGWFVKGVCLVIGIVFLLGIE